MKVISTGIVVLLLLAAATPGSAADDVKPLQAPTVFPLTIDAPGTYRLTSDLKVPSEDMTGIKINANDVTIDLGGFSIIGPTVCLGSPVECSPTGSGQGILSDKNGTTVLNGTIRGMGGDGVALLGINGHVERVQVSSNGGNGISSMGPSTLSRNTVTANGAFGMLVLSGSTLSENTSQKNGKAGIQCVLNCKLDNNTADATLVPEKPIQ